MKAGKEYEMFVFEKFKDFLTGLNLHLMIELLETKAILKEKLIFQ